jgi:drug/metabolite transporter (DMT)-like permease
MNNPVIMMAIGALLIAFSPILTKAVDLPATPIGFYRFFFATITTGLIVLFKRSNMRDGFIIRDFKKSLPYLILSGLFFSIDLWFWNRSILSVGSGVATLLANTQVFYLAIVGLLVFKERLRFFFYPAMLIAVIGIWLTSLPYLNVAGMNDKTMGIVYGLLTGVSYSLVTFSLRKSNDHFKGDPILIVFFMTFFAMIFSLVISLAEGSFQIIQGKDIFYMVIYGSVVHFLGWLFISKSIKVIPIALASLLLLLQPAFATILGYFIYDEYLNALQILGLILSLVGIYLAMRARE